MAHGGIRDDLFDAAFLGRVEQLALLARRMATSGQRAQRRSRKVGSGIEFADHRDYSPGDDVRALDWKLFARTERLNLKLYEEEEDLSVYFLVDHSASMGLARPGGRTLLDRALQVTAALAYIALGNLDRVTIVPFRATVDAPGRAVRGRAQYFRVLRALSPIEAAGRTGVAASIDAFVRRQPRRGLVVVLSDLYDPAGLGDALRALHLRGYEPMVLHLHDLSLLETDAYGDVTLLDTETGDLRDVCLTPDLLARYRVAFAEFCADIDRAAREVGARCLHVDLAVPFDDVVMRVFRLGGFLS